MHDASSVSELVAALRVTAPVHVAMDWLEGGGQTLVLGPAAFRSRMPAEWEHLAPADPWTTPPLVGDPPIVACGAWDADDVLASRRTAQLSMWLSMYRWQVHDDDADGDPLAAAEALYHSCIADAVAMPFTSCVWDDALAPLSSMPAVARGVFDTAVADGRPHDWASVASRIRRALQLDLSLFFPPGGPWHDPIAVRRLERAAEGDLEWMVGLAKPSSQDALAMMRSLPDTLRIADPLAQAMAAFAATPAAAKPLPDPTTLLLLHREWHGCRADQTCDHIDKLLSVTYNLTLPMLAGAAPPPQPPVAVALSHPGYAALQEAVHKAVAQGVYEQVRVEDVDPLFEAGIFPVPKRRANVDAGHLAAAESAMHGDLAGHHELARLSALAASSCLDNALKIRTSQQFELAMSAVSDVVSWRAVFDGRKQGTCADMQGLSMRMESLSTLIAGLHDDDGVGVVDVAGGFHHVQLAPPSRRLAWFRFEGKVYRAVRLPFGLTVSPFIFCCLSAEIRAILRHRGVDVAVTFVDEFLYRERLGARLSAGVIRATFTELHVGLAEDKFKEPAAEQQALGIIVSTARRCIYLPADRLALLHVYLHMIKRTNGVDRARFPGYFIRHVVGKLSHLASVTRGAAAFMGPLHHLRAAADERGYEWVVPHLVTSQLDSAIDFFLSPSGYSGTSLTLDRPLGAVAVGAPGCISSDASRRDAGTGGFFGGVDADGHGIWGRFHPTFACESTALLELYAMVCSAMHFAAPDRHYHLLTDSSAAAAVLNRGRSGSGCKHTVKLLKAFHLWLNQNRIDVHAVFLPRQLMTIPDAITNAPSLAHATSLSLHCPAAAVALTSQKRRRSAWDSMDAPFLPAGAAEVGLLRKLQPILPGLSDGAIAAMHHTDTVAPRRRRMVGAVISVYGADVGQAPALEDLGTAIVGTCKPEQRHATLRRYEEAQASDDREAYPLTMERAIGFVAAGVLEHGFASTGVERRLATLVAEAQAEGKPITEWDGRVAARSLKGFIEAFPAEPTAVISPVTAADFTAIHSHLGRDSMSDDDIGYLCLLGLWIATGCRGGELPDLMWAHVHTDRGLRTVSCEVVLSKTNKRTLKPEPRVGYDETPGLVIIATLEAGRARLASLPGAHSRVAVRCTGAPTRLMGLPWRADAITKRTNEILLLLGLLGDRSISRKSARGAAHDRNEAAGFASTTSKRMQGWKTDSAAARYTTRSSRAALEAEVAAGLKAATGGGGGEAVSGK